VDSLVTQNSEMGYKKLYLDFLNDINVAGINTVDNNAVEKFFPVESVQCVVDSFGESKCERDQLVAILEDQNKGFGASDLTIKNINILKQDKKTLCTFAGQQACLFGGPLLVIMKALGVIKSAHYHSRRLKQAVVPIFWIAGDDHDFEEINHTTLLDRMTKTVRVSYDTPPNEPVPASEIRFNDSETLVQALKSLKETLGQSDFTDELYAIIESSYTDSDTFVSAFGKLLTKLTSEFGLILFNPADAHVKKLAVPFFKKIIEKQDELHKVLDDTNRELQQAGYHLQVQKKTTSTHLFYNLNGRQPIIRHGDQYAVGKLVLSDEELIDLIEKEPERFSPDVITRPLMQAHLFPTVLQLGGPAEIAYFAQIGRLYQVFDIVSPCVQARPSATIIEKRFAVLMNKHDLDFKDIVDDIEQVVNRVLDESFPEDIKTRFDSVRADISNNFDILADSTLDIDPSLEVLTGQIRGRIDYILKGYENKVFSSHKKKSQAVRERLYRLRNSLYPQSEFQERSLNVCYFIAKYGMSIINMLYERINIDQKDHQLIDIGEMDS